MIRNVYANSSLCCHFIDDVMDIAEKNPFHAIEWDLNYIPLSLNEQRLESLYNTIEHKKLQIRYHLPHSFIDIAHKDPRIRTYSTSVLEKYLDFIKKLAGTYAVIHIGQFQCCDMTTAISNLSALSMYSQKKGIHLCLENTTSGLSADPDFLETALNLPYIYLCLDIGHANFLDIDNSQLYHVIKRHISKCQHIHLYQRLDGYTHVPFTEKKTLICDKYLNLARQSGCRWLTMETEYLCDQNYQINLCNEVFG